ncbi:hypothetical protein GCM10023196_063560 [Actinoallomurus vinaceus]|uniref:Uncharacterized protein n=1 Tax=Actinoallomurus vinaceus TaxID=1080074 RepID=A0ABP8UKA0_9ACTN
MCPPVAAVRSPEKAAAISRGDWYTDSTDLRQLIGRPAAPLANVVTAALKAL